MLTDLIDRTGSKRGTEIEFMVSTLVVKSPWLLLIGAFRSCDWNRTSIFAVFKFIMSYHHFQKSAVEFYCMCSDDCQAGHD